MRVLWITSDILPSPGRAIGIAGPVSGGWIISLLQCITRTRNIQLAVATVYDGSEEKRFHIEGILYYLLPAKPVKTYQKSLEPYWQKICSEFNPDIVHIHGTEYLHGLACMRSCPAMKYVISIQGIVGVISRYFTGGMSTLEIFRHITFRDIVKGDSILQIKREFARRGILEREYFLRSQHVIGRTSWDYVHTKAINPDISYHFCNELLRDGFYSSAKRNPDDISHFTVFLSQGSYPIKGLHMAIKAIAMLKTDFPAIKLRVAGDNIISNKTIIQKIKLRSYGAYLNRLIKKLNLYNHIEFIGMISEEQMIAEYRSAHIFLCPSSIENSPNSLGEAQIIGVPSIAAYAGGIPDMITHRESGLLYRFEEFEMLAHSIRSIFLDSELALKLSEGGKEAATKRHDRETNTNRLLRIYEEIIHGK